MSRKDIIFFLFNCLEYNENAHPMASWDKPPDGKKICVVVLLHLFEWIACHKIWAIISSVLLIKKNFRRPFEKTVVGAINQRGQVICLVRFAKLTGFCWQGWTSALPFIFYMSSQVSSTQFHLDTTLIHFVLLLSSDPDASDAGAVSKCYDVVALSFCGHFQWPWRCILWFWIWCKIIYFCGRCAITHNSIRHETQNIINIYFLPLSWLASPLSYLVLTSVCI